MRRTFILLISAGLFFSFSEAIKAQAVVTDPGNTAINASIKALNEISNRVQSFLAKTQLMELSTDVIDQVNSVQQIATLIDELECLTTDFQFYMNLNKSYSCASYLNFKLITFNLSYSTDMLSKVILAKNIFTMKSADRLNFLEIIRNTLDKTIQDLTEINKLMKQATVEKMLQEHVNKTYYTPQNLSFNRYKK